MNNIDNITNIDYMDENDKFIENINLKTYKQNLSVEKDIRYKYGEINTPFSLIENMLNLFDNDIFSDKNKKWLDIGAGCGYFSIVLFKKLYEGLKNIIKNDRERKNHIIKNMIYMAELREDNWNILESSYLFTKESNIIKGDFLSISDDYIIKIIGKGERKFDYIIGNPPYNNNGIKKVPTNKNNIKNNNYNNNYNNGEKNTDNNGENNTDNNGEKNKLMDNYDYSNVWVPFIKKSINLLNNKGQMVVVIPSIWMKPDKAKMYDLLTSYKLEYIYCMNNTETNKIFNGSAQTPTCYFKLTKEKSPNFVTIYDKHFDTYIEWNIFNKNPIPVFGASILKKVFEIIIKNPNKKLNVNKTNLPQKNSKFSINETLENRYNCINTCKLIGVNKDTPSLITEYSNIQQAFYGKPKLILAHKMYGFPYIDDQGKYGISNRDNYVILNKSNTEMNILKDFLSTKLALYLFETTRYRMKYLEKYIFDLIPDITLFDEFKTFEENESGEKRYTDTDYYKFFNLNNKEIEIINNFINRNYKSF